MTAEQLKADVLSVVRRCSSTQIHRRKAGVWHVERGTVQKNRDNASGGESDSVKWRDAVDAVTSPTESSRRDRVWW